MLSRTSPHPAALDALLDGYVTWRERSAAVGASYQRWTSSGPEERELAFQAYLAALDREEESAAVYQRLIDQDPSG